jgi:hypothetical protein
MIVAVIFSILVHIHLSLASFPLNSQNCEIIAVTTDDRNSKPTPPPFQEHIHLIIEFGDTFLVFHKNGPALILDGSNLEKSETVLRVNDQSCDQITQNLYLRSRVHETELEGYSNRTVTILYKYGILLVVKNPMEILDGFTSLVESFDVSERMVTVAVTSRGYVPDDIESDDIIKAIPDNLDVNRWFQHASKLASYNRYTPGQGIVTAQNWLYSELGRYGSRITTSQQSWTSGSYRGINTIATIPGSDPNSLVVVGAHFDSTSQSPSTAAPGAEDDGSGSAALLEFLRVLVESGTTFRKTIVLVWFGGEEQGLLGSRAYVTSLVNSGRASTVSFALCMDMVGYSSSNTKFSVILETQSRYSSQLTPLRNAAAQYSRNLEVVISYNPFGSDHMSFLDRNIPSALAIDGDWDKYPYYHRTTDTADKLVPEIALLIMKMNVGAIVTMAS